MILTHFSVAFNKKSYLYLHVVSIRAPTVRAKHLLNTIMYNDIPWFFPWFIMKFSDFPWFSPKRSIFPDFPWFENKTLKFPDSPCLVLTLVTLKLFTEYHRNRVTFWTSLTITFKVIQPQVLYLYLLVVSLQFTADVFQRAFGEHRFAVFTLKLVLFSHDLVAKGEWN